MVTVTRSHDGMDGDVAIAAVIHIAERQRRPTTRSVFTVLYDAEKRHLRDPRAALGVEPDLVELGHRHLVVRERGRIEVLAPCDLEALSQSAIECMGEALGRARAMTERQRGG